MKQSWPAAERNKHPLLEVLRRVLPQDGGTLLEVASGTGQHVTHFAAALPAWRFHPTDRDEENLVSIRAWIEDSAVSNVEAPARLDVTDTGWPVARADAVFNANMIHIAPWEVTPAFFAGASRVLASGSPLLMYGPYKRGGEHTAPSNLKFDESLRSRDPAWGVRNLEDVIDAAAQHGFAHEETVEMPANNLTVIYRRE